MAGDYNLVVLVGRLGRDPDLRILQDGTPVATFSLAVDKAWKDRSGEWKRETHWFNVVCWRGLAERVSDQFGKGNHVLVQGELQTRSYETKDNGKRTVVEVKAALVRRMDSSGKAADGGAPVAAGVPAGGYFGDDDPGAPPDL